MLADYIMLSPFLSNIPVRGAVNVLALALGPSRSWFGPDNRWWRYGLH